MWTSSLCRSVSRHGIGFRQLDGAVRPSPERRARNEELGKQLAALEVWARAGGGEKGRARQKAQGKLPVRERLGLLLDAGAEWQEVGLLAGREQAYGDIPAAGQVVGLGQVSGRHCVVIANDASVKGGTIYPMALKKALRGQELAAELRLPVLYLSDSGGAFLPLQREIFLPGGRTFFNEAVLGSEGLAQLGLVCGTCTAGGAYTPTMCDEVVFVEGAGSLFLGGPPLVKAATGEEVGAQELGGAALHCFTSGAADHFAPDEAQAFQALRDLVSCLPPHLGQRESIDLDAKPPVFDPAELADVAGDETPGVEFVRRVLARVVDESRLLEFREGYGAGVLCGLGRVGGRLVGVVAGTGESLDARGAEKAAHWVRLCGRRGVALLFVQRSLGAAAEASAGGLRARAALLAAAATADVPKLSLNVGGCEGEDLLLLGGPGMQPTFSLGWPTARLSHSEGSSLDGFGAAAHMCIDALVPPRDTRRALAHLLALSPTADGHQQPKHHDAAPIFRF